MAERIHSFDWSGTPLGPPDTWSPALRTTLRIVLANRFPHILWWGPEYIQFYNDAYRPIPGEKHPDRVLGRPAAECWSEIWHVIGPLIDRPFRGGAPTWDDDIFLEIRRHGFLEESHFVIAYSPVPDETVPSGIGGVLATVHEITEKIVADRRVRALRDLGAHAGDAKTAEEACAFAAATLSRQAKDVPFAIFYLIDADGRRAHLAGTAGVAAGSDPAPLDIDLEREDESRWPLLQCAREQAMQVVEKIGERFRTAPAGPWTDPPHTAAVLPIPASRPHELSGLMVLGASARLRFDETYRDFFHLLQTQVAAAVTSARAYQEERRRAQALAEIDRAKTAFFSNVSHEFRTPLTLMLGPVGDLLNRGPGDLSPATKSELEVVHRNGLRLLRLVNTLLDFSRIEAGRVRAAYQPTDLASSTVDLASVFRAAVEKAGLELIIDCPPLPEPAYVDREMWEKIVLNLLSNAFKYTFEGRIRVSLRPEDGDAELTVRDTGTGIPEEEIPHLFERFHRVENARGRTHEGSGIGLALVQELVRLHGGRIRAESALGSGSAFVVRIPLGSRHLPPDRIVESREPRPAGSGVAPFVEEAMRWLPESASASGSEDLPRFPESIPGPELSAAPDDAPRPRVLVADDNFDMRHYVERLLAGRYEVEALSDGLAALESAERRPPDLIVTDVMMPRLDGFGLLRAVRADETLKDVPVIMLSARAGEESRVTGVQAGADDYLVKPFSARELLARVDAHLKMARLRRDANESIRRSNEELSRRARQFETLLDAAPLGAFLIDADFRIVELNPVAVPAFGAVPGGVLGRGFDEVVRALAAPERADAIVRIFRRTLETGEPHVTPEDAIFRIDRNVTEFYEGRVDRITLPDGGYGLVCYFRDISEQVAGRSERERLLLAEQSARREAEAANRVKDDFVATLSHELRTPLNAIVGWSEILSRRPLEDPTLQQGIDAIGRNALAQTRLIEDLLDMSRVVSGKLRLEWNPVSVAGVLGAAIDSVRPSADAKGLVITSSLDPSARTVAGDATRLQQVVWNLLTNGVKFTPRGGAIAVSSKRTESRVEITVRDNGAGIPAEFLPLLFDRFRQADPSASRRHGGLGIGLTLVKQLVERHGGTVRAASDGVGRGATFTVTLPLMNDAPVLAAASAEGADPAQEGTADAKALQGVRVLFVDDDADSRRLGERILADAGAEVIVAVSAAEALSLLRGRRPDVLVSDVGLPEIDGYELVRRVRALTEQEGGRTPAAALTAFAGSEDRRKAFQAGYQSHLAKPVAPAELVAVLSALASRGSRRPS
ncbi:MAG TPA: ATP-binding protein [Thermoanaerobaculia bacterium]|jgi:signal transduction histidine kinase